MAIPEEPNISVPYSDPSINAQYSEFLKGEDLEDKFEAEEPLFETIKDEPVTIGDADPLGLTAGSGLWTISKKQKESNKKRLKFEKQIKELKIKLNSQTNKLKQTKSLDNWYNNFATSVEIDKIIKIGAGNPKSEVEENAFIKGIADTKGIPNLEEGIFEQLYNELRPGSALMNK